MDSYQEHQAELHNAISAVAEGSIITHYVVVAAGMDEDGDMVTHTISSPGLTYWMKHGLLATTASATLPIPDWVEAHSHDED